MLDDINPFGFALTEDNEEQFDRILMISAMEPICVRLRLLMEARRWNAAVFAERTGLEDYLFGRIVRNNVKRPSLGTIIAICVALCLNYPQTLDLLVSGGMSFGNAPLHRAYSRLILEMHGRSVDECNDYLLARGFPLLGSAARDE